MNKLIPLLVSKIYDRCAHTKEMLDFIQIDGHMSQRAKVLQKLGINSVQGSEQLAQYRDLVIQHQLMLTVADYVLCKHPWARRQYNRLINRVYKFLNDAEKTIDDSAGKV